VWTVGNNFNADILIPKLDVAESVSFVIVSDNGHFYFRGTYTYTYNITIIDFSILPINKVPNVKIAKTEEK
jgi:hypothetical protein